MGWARSLLLDPYQFENAAQGLSSRERTYAIACITYHLWPYVAVASGLVRWLAFGVFEVKFHPLFYGGFWATRDLSASDIWTHAEVLAVIHLLGLGIIIAYTIVTHLSLPWSILTGLLAGRIIGTWIGSLSGPSASITLGVMLGLATALLGRRRGHGLGLTLGATATIFFPAAAAANDDPLGGLILGVVGGLVFGIAGSTCVSLGILRGRHLFFLPVIFMPVSFLFGLMVSFNRVLFLGLSGWSIAFVVSAFRLPYFAIHYALMQSSTPRLYSCHPVSWDRSCLLPFPDLHKLLVQLVHEDPIRGNREIDRLIETYPSQKAEAIRSRVQLLAADAENIESLSEIEALLTRLPSHLELNDLQESAKPISRLQTEYQDERRLHVREGIARSIFRKITILKEELSQRSPTFSQDFRVAVDKWLENAAAQLERSRARAAKERAPQVFRSSGPPVRFGVDAFIPRVRAISELEHQVTRRYGSGLLTISGRRRMGKTTLLSNLTRTSSLRLKVATIPMQDPRAFSSLEGFVDLILAKMHHYVPVNATAQGGLPALFSTLAQVDEVLDEREDFLLLGIDEFEYLDMKIAQGVLPDDLLAIFRECSQSLRRVRLAFVGSTPVEDLKGANWPSFLVGARNVDVGPFELEETHLLLTKPRVALEGFEEAVHFEPAFWSSGGIERIHMETGGWPHLVQLVAESVVEIVNRGERERADVEVLEAALTNAVRAGQMAFSAVIKGECAVPGEWEFLQSFRKSPRLPRPLDDSIVRSLKKRRLVGEENGSLRLLVPMVARWLRERF